MLPAYWIFLACCTHFPRLKLDWGVSKPDKWAHLIAFGVLAFMLWRFAETFRRPLAGRQVMALVVVLVVYAAIDEYTQQFVGRSTDVGDWLMGLVGMGAVLGPLEVHRRLVRRERA